MSDQTFRNIFMILMTFVPGILVFVAFHVRDELIRAEREKEKEMRDESEKFVFDPNDLSAMCEAVNLPTAKAGGLQG